MAGADRGHGAVLDSGRDSLDPGRLEPLDDVVGLEPGRKIDIAEGQVEKRVAERSADVTGQAFSLRRARREGRPCRAAAASASASSLTSIAAAATG
jgi:hypothetical protein